MKNAAKKFMRQLSEYELITIDEKSNNKINEILSSNFDVEYGFDSPDIPLIYDKKIIALEEFEFDSSKTKKKSSKQKEEVAQLDREKKYTIDPIVQHHSFKNNGSLEYYNENLLRSLKHHISRYEMYQYNAKKISNEKAIEFGFVIDNTSLMPDLIKRDGKLLIVTPFMIPEFVKQIKLNEWIKHIFYIFTNMNKRQILYVYVDENDFNHYEEDHNHVQINDEYVQLNAKSLSVNLILPRKKSN